MYGIVSPTTFSAFFVVCGITAFCFIYQKHALNSKKSFFTGSDLDYTPVREAVNEDQIQAVDLLPPEKGRC